MERWNESALDERFRGIEAHFKSVDEILAVLSSLPMEVARASQSISHNSEDIKELEIRIIRDIDQIRAELQGNHKQLKSDIKSVSEDLNIIQENLKQGRRSIVISLIGFAGTLSAAVVTGTIALIVNFT